MAISEELELDVSSGLAAIERVGAELDQATKQFKVGLADALDVLRGVQVEVDASAVTGSLNDAIGNADTTVTVEGDAAPVTDAVQQSLFDADNVFAVDGDTTELVADIAAVEAEPIVVPVEADTTGAQEQVDGLGTSASGAASNVDALDGAVSGLAAGAGLATGQTGALKSVISGTGAVAAAGVTGIGLLAAVTDKYFSSAVNAAAATERFNNTFGPFAEQVNTINVGNLNKDLVELNLSLGSSTSQTRNAISSYAQMGQAAGASSKEIADSSEQLIALGARAVALNPQIGTVGDAVAGLSRGLARGGRFAAQYGVALTSAEISARALEIAHARGSTEVQQFDKVMAGAQLATEKYGATLDQVITQGTQNPVIQLASLRAELAKVTTEAGKPLIAPVFEILRGAQPVLTSTIKLFGDLLSSVLPLASGILNAIGPVISALETDFAGAFKELKPGIAELSNALTHVLDGFVPVIESAGPIVKAFGTGLGEIAKFVGVLLNALGPVVPAIIGIWVALQLLNANPLLLVATAAITLIGALHGVNNEADRWAEFNGKVNAQSDQFQQTIIGQADSVDALRESMAKGQNEWAKYVATQSEFSKDQAVLTTLQKTNISFADLRGELASGAAGWKEFIAQAIAAGQVDIQVKGVSQSADDFRNLANWQDVVIQNNGANIKQGSELVQAFNRQQTAQEDAAKATVNQLLATGQLTQEQVDQAAQISESVYGFSQYQSVLAIVTDKTNALGAAVQQQAFPLQQNTEFWRSLTAAIINGDVTSQNYAQTLSNVAGQMGLTDEQIKTFVSNVTDSVNQLADSMVTRIPPASQALEGIGDAADPKKLQDNLYIQTLTVANFTNNLRTLLAGGNEQLVALLAQQGPQIGGSYAQAILNGRDGLAEELEKNIGVYQSNASDLESFLRNEAAPAIANDGVNKIAQDSTDALGLGLDFTGAAQGPVAGLNSFLSSNPSGQSAMVGGSQAGQDFARGLATGMINNTATVQEAARKVVQDAEEAARQEADSHSPSRLFAALGRDISAGIAIGINAGQLEVDSALRGLVKQGAVQIAVTPVTQPVLVGAAAPVGVAAAATPSAAAAPAPLIGEITILEAESARQTANEVVDEVRGLQIRTEP